MTRDDQPQFQATVLSRQLVTNQMVRVTVGGITPLQEDAVLRAGSFADEFFGLWVPGDDGVEIKRYYTVRRWRPEPGELDIDMLLHGHGPATQWAARAAVGDVVRFDATRGHFRVPVDARWVGVCGDATALPAIGRVLEERAWRSDAMPVHVVVSVDDPADRQDLVLRQGDTLRWVSSGDLVAATLALTQQPEPGYLWFSGEAADMRAVRAQVRHVLHWPTERWMTMGYWRRDSERWLERFVAEGPALRSELEAIYASADDEQAQADQAEELLADRGLL